MSIKITVTGSKNEDLAGRPFFRSINFFFSMVLASETNNRGFEIERLFTRHTELVSGSHSPIRHPELVSGSALAPNSLPKNNKTSKSAITEEWQTAGFVPGAGTTTEPHSYSFTDTPPSCGTYTYRLKQVDFDGSYKYSPEVSVEFDAPEEFTLLQNYPNPFNISTTIIYQITRPGFVSLKVYGVLGNEAAVLVNEQKSPGAYSVVFDGSGLASGIYILRLHSDSFTFVRKLVLLK